MSYNLPESFDILIPESLGACYQKISYIVLSLKRMLTILDISPPDLVLESLVLNSRELLRELFYWIRYRTYSATKTFLRNLNSYTDNSSNFTPDDVINLQKKMIESLMFNILLEEAV